MKYAVVFESPTGNTGMLAEEIRNYYGEESCVYFGQCEGAVCEADLIFVGFWTDKGDCSEKTAEYLEKLTDSRVFLFGTAGFGGSEEYFSQIISRVEKHLAPGNVVAGSYMCQGKMPAGVRKRYESMLEQNPDDPKMKMMIENFDRALSHPNEEDLKKIRFSLEKMGQ